MKKLRDFLVATSDLIYYAVFLWILIIVLFFQELKTIEWVRISFLLPNLVLLAIFIAFTAVIYLCSNNKSTPGLVVKQILELPQRHPVIVSGISFLLIAFVSYATYFRTGWDAGTVIGAAEYAAVGNELEEGQQGYFSWNQNNALLFCIYKLIFTTIGVGLTTEYQLYIIILIQCLIAVFTMMVVSNFLAEYTGSKCLGSIGWWLTFILIGTSPWIAITYSDSLTVFVPIAMLRIYQKIKATKFKAPWWLLLFFLAFWAYRIKAISIIVLIAIFISEILNLLANLSAKKAGILAGEIASLVLVFLLSNALFSLVCSKSGLVLTEENSSSMWHYLMMGQNEEHDGGFNFPDADFSLGISDRQEREEANRDQIKQRIKEMFPDRLFKFEMRKTLVSYHDGTFSYGVEGHFYTEPYGDRLGPVSKYLKEWFWDTGKFYPILATLHQIFWLGTLLLCTLMFPIRRDEGYVLRISLIGMFIFILLFEGQARYLYTFVPVYITGAVLGLWSVITAIKKRAVK